VIINFDQQAQPHFFFPQKIDFNFNLYHSIFEETLLKLSFFLLHLMLWHFLKQKNKHLATILTRGITPLHQTQTQMMINFKFG
jgi:hypothetical protein